MEFTITKERFGELILGDCVYCSAKPSRTIRVGYLKNHPHPTFRYNGVNRKNNSLGYIEGNVVSCCTACNTVKNKFFSFDEFKVMMNALFEYRAPQETNESGTANSYNYKNFRNTK